MKAERDFKLVCTGGPYGDCCCSYDIELRGEWTVQEFVEAVLKKNGNEWGYFYIGGGRNMFDKPYRAEYRYGKLKEPIQGKIARRKIKRVTAHGGWSLMDYTVDI